MARYQKRGTDTGIDCFNVLIYMKLRHEKFQWGRRKTGIRSTPSDGGQAEAELWGREFSGGPGNKDREAADKRGRVWLRRETGVNLPRRPLPGPDAAGHRR